MQCGYLIGDGMCGGGAPIFKVVNPSWIGIGYCDSGVYSATWSVVT